MPTLSRVFVLFVLFGSFGAYINAQTPGSMPDEKRKLIVELVSILKIEEQMSKTSDALLTTYEKAYPVVFSNAIDDLSGFSNEEKSQMKAEAVQNYRDFSVKFKKRLPEVLDYSKFVQENLYPLYDKYYGEQELKDMITFYKSPTGQKVIESTPLLTAESASASLKLLPQVMSLVDEIVKEQVDEKAPRKGTNSKN